jgi:hypothetical protein
MLQCPSVLVSCSPAFAAIESGTPAKTALVDLKNPESIWALEKLLARPM